MNYIPYEFPKEKIGNEIYERFQQEHHIFQQRRKELSLTQQQVADKARIQLRQYQRLESGEQSVSGTSSRILFSVCQVLRLDPEFILGLSTVQSVPEHQKRKSIILPPVADDGIYYYIPQYAYFLLVSEIPCGMIATYDSIRDCLCKAYNLQNADIKSDMNSYQLHSEKAFPYWRVVSQRGHLLDMIYSSKESQKQLLEAEHLEIKEEETREAYSVVDYKKYLFSFENLNISVMKTLRQISKNIGISEQE